ncbi:MAG: rod shape-determining protein MreD [Prevotellaceae bacterium]|jgi:rod shape-determining protein MreD|nr:rod shape-determining protein MreD [Prevotellaceae bacterium]
MNTNILRLLLFLLILILVQDIVIDKLPFGTYAYPALYTAFILFLPFNYAAAPTLMWAFAMGLCIDIFSMDVIGLHTAALLFMAYIRPKILKRCAAKDDMGSSAMPSIRILGLGMFFIYIGLSLLAYNTVLFMLDTFSVHHFQHTAIRILLSTLATSILVTLLHFAVKPQRK